MIESNLSLRALYENRKNAHNELRERIMDILGCSRETFFRRMANNDWTDLEKKLISADLGIDVDILFPLNQESHA